MPSEALLSVSARRLPVSSMLVLLTVFVGGMFVAGFDQGHLFSLAQGQMAFDEMLLHELTHDVRHAAGLPCH